MRTFLLASMLLTLVACARDEAQVLVPEDVEIAWDASYNGYDDGIGAVVPVDIMVYEAATGEPVDFVDLEVRAADEGVLLFLPEALVPCELEDDRELLWDVRQDMAYELVEADEGPVALRTDSDGLARVGVLVDAFPLTEVGDFDAVTVSISTELGDESFSLVPR